MGKPRLLMVIPEMHSFIQQDIAMLSADYQIEINTYNWRNKALAPWFLFLQTLSLLIKIPSCRVVLVQFGGYWSLVPTMYGKLFKKPVYIVLHGTDCASIPALNYGSLRIPLLQWFCKKSYEWATKLLPVSESLIYTKNSFINLENPVMNGLKHHFPDLKTPIEVIPNGFDVHYWIPNDRIKNEILKTGTVTFLTVMSPAQFTLKGGDLILEFAMEKPDFQFRFAGLECPSGIAIPSNVSFLGRLDKESLRKEYQSAHYYFQLSSYEGFGCALCEAMLCGCIPIVSEVNALPSIIGVTGITVPFRKLSNLRLSVQLIHSMAQGKNINQTGRERIKALYPLANRKSMLLATLTN